MGPYNYGVMGYGFLSPPATATTPTVIIPAAIRIVSTPPEKRIATS